ncbi:hypothetical protein ACFLRW_00925 [Acidobacteriota bacterium]
MKRSARIITIFFLASGFSLFYGCAVPYNVLGSWTITLSYPGGGVKTFSVTFGGQKNEGSLTLSGGGWNATGTYEVKNKTIDFEVSSAEGDITFTGSMDSDNEMRGTANMNAVGSIPIDVTWVGIRN